MAGVLEQENIDFAHKNSHRQFLCFTVRGEEYGVDIMCVREIRVWSEVTHLPNSPDYMHGVINLRGLIIPIFDLGARFNQGHTQASAQHAVIILEVQNHIIGIQVDAVSDILSIDSSEVKLVPESENQKNADFVNGLIAIENRMVVLLAVEKLFNIKDMRSIHQPTEIINHS